MPRITDCRYHRKACARCRRRFAYGFRFPMKLSLLFLAFIAVAQQPEAPLTTFKTSSNLVIVNVFVRDKSGTPVEGLKKEDFKLLEDGKGQNIAVFEFQKLEDPAPAAPAAPKPVPSFAARPVEAPK